MLSVYMYPCCSHMYVFKVNKMFVFLLLIYIIFVYFQIAFGYGETLKLRINNYAHSTHDLKGT